jgi:hypothetical protein
MNRNNASKLPFFKRRKVIVSLIILIVLAIGAGLWVYGNRDQTKVGKTSSGGYVNLGPATKAERKEAENHKKNLGEDSDSDNKQTTTSSGKRQVTPVITSIDKSSVRGFIQGIIEDGGTCTVTLTQGSKTVTKTSTGVADASYTTCSTIELEGAITPGSWKAVLSYSSGAAEGKSNPRSYEIQ